MKDIQVTINPTEIKSLNFNNAFNQKPGGTINLKVNNEIAIKLNPATPMVAVVLTKVSVDDEANHTITMQVETITSVVVSTYVDDLDQFIKTNYMPIIMMAANEKVRSVSALLGVPIRIPNPKFNAGGSMAAPESEGNGFLQ